MTSQLIRALVDANKDFELMYLPQQDHAYFSLNPYFLRRRWDFFVRALLGEQPPQDYRITDPQLPRAFLGSSGA